jgi:hypothetical protein
MTQEIHIQDIGTSFELAVYDGDVVVDISTASALIILFQKPDGTTTSRTGVLLTDGTDGVIQYITVTNDLDQVGTWQAQARVSLSAGTWSSDTHKFKVYPNLDS